ncbi:septum formation inhibitor Maf [Paenalkalicoccus suaedae]|uniref:dTTP/UTP pyrophosphatase n=1 Tax=Paenalkalicoccus suaedae TaxID=2592382 RepID=A0A859FFR0_9BACI|nr:Maf family protein [Paenalkalicoccus suaedae]QKS71851.1 septum formation inhibitor Maf [Paenalkalicoccus suaedae]
MKPILLASQSPRRKQLLDQVGITFTVKPSDYEEDHSLALPPTELVQQLAYEKARDVFVREEKQNSIIIGADTLVALDDEVLGKPRDDHDAKQMLMRLSGKKHQVHTGVAILSSTQESRFTESADVYFYPLTESEIDAYIKSGEPADKAGAYGIQGLGATLVERIEGDYFSIVGLPIAKVVRVIKNHY